jgi:hypothetical protein
MGVLIAACSSRAHRVFIVFLDPLFSRRSDLLDCWCVISPSTGRLDLLEIGAHRTEVSRTGQA